MRRLTIAVLIVALLPATAVAYDGSYPDCLASPIAFSDNGTPRLTDTMEHRDDGALRIGTVGSFLWVSYNNTGPRGMILGDVLSIEVPTDAVFVEACMNGNVTFTYAAPEPTPDAELAPAVEVTNLWAYWADIIAFWMQRLFHNITPF